MCRKRIFHILKRGIYMKHVVSKLLRERHLAYCHPVLMHRSRYRCSEGVLVTN